MSKTKNREPKMQSPDLERKGEETSKSPLMNIAWALFFIGIIAGLFFAFRSSQEKEKNEVRDEFAEYADEIGIDKDEFKKEYDKEKHNDKPKAHTKEARDELKLTSTPTIFVNGEQVSGAYEELKEKVQEQIDLGDDVKYEKHEDSEAVYTVRSDDYVKGNPDAKVVIIEYSQFTCPACAVQQPNINKLVEDFPDQIQVVFRHYNFQDKADESSRAVEAAGTLGKFWEMADILFEKQGEWGSH